MDGDGRLDVVTGGGDLFLQRKDGTFRRIELDFPERQASLGLGDVDGDGRPDIMTGGGERWVDDTSHLYPRRLLLNKGAGRFEDATEEYGFASDSYGRSVVFADFDDDGDQDVYFGNYRLAANELWRRGPDGFTECAEALGVRGKPHEHEGHGPFFGHTIAASWCDLDGDGWLDLWVSNLVHKYVGPWPKSLSRFEGEDIRGYLCDDSNLFRNAGAPSFLFTDRRAESGIAVKPIGGRGVYQGDELWSNCAAADFDLDGDLDVFVTQVYKQPYSRSFLFRNDGGFRFTPVDAGFRVFNGYGAAWADVDGDGRPDLITGGSAGGPNAPRGVRLWRNTTEGGAWIGFRFQPPALGAVVRVITKTRVLTRLAESGMGSHAQANSDVLHVGLGDEAIEEVRVSWPGGAEQRVPRPKPGRVHVIHAPKGRQPPARLVLAENDLVVKTAVRGVTYHWDLDDDFRTDRVTKKPRCPLPENAEPRSVAVRIFRGDVGVRARLTIR
jgi:hypothetical protein